MPVGFFHPGQFATRETTPTVPRCHVCRLYRDCKSPKMKPTGKGRKKILVVAEAPGEQEDDDGVQLVGKSGQRLRSVLSGLGIDLNRDCWKTNAVVCHQAGNATPTDEQIQNCRPNLMKAIVELQPRTIILLGGIAIKSLISVLWKDTDLGPIGRWIGWKIPSQKLNAWVCPAHHPAYLLRSNDSVLDLWFENHLREAVSLKGRPWSTVPDYGKDVECIYEPEKAAIAIRKMRDGVVAFDYETNMLKPDSKKARIVSCAVCWEGKRTIAYPWHGEAVVATSELLLNPAVKKIGANNKFEQRWTKRILGHGVAGWLWDTMVVSHLLDNRKGITSVKFQGFVLLGMPIWNKAVDSLLVAKGSNVENRIREADLGELLLYNGLDARVEWEIAKKQMEVMNYGGEH